MFQDFNLNHLKTDWYTYKTTKSLISGFFLDISKKKLKQIFEKLQQIIQKFNNLPTKNWFFAQKSP